MTETLTRHGRVAGLLLAAVIPFTAACSSTASESPGATSSSAATTSSGASTTTSETTPDASNAAYCDALREGQAELEKITGSINDPEAAKQGLAVIEKIQASAPAEVKDAWADFTEFVEVVVAGDTAALPTVMEKMSTSMTTIEEHAKTECGIDMS